MGTSRSFPLAAVTTCLLAIASAVEAQPGRFTAIDYPGATDTLLYGINPAGDIVGGYYDTAGREHGFALRNGSFISFDWPGSTWTEGWGINPQGDIVGQYGLTESGFKTIHGFLLKDGELLDIDVPGQPNTMPVKVSPEGVIVGCYHVGLANGSTILNTMYGYVQNDAGLASHASNRTMNNGVNPDGDVVGFYFSPVSGRVEWSYLIRDEETTWFQVPGSAVTQAWDINPSGAVVGFHRITMTTPVVFHGFVFDDGEMTSFDYPGAVSTRAYGISATGDIVGYYVDASGRSHGFLRSHRGPE